MLPFRIALEMSVEDASALWAVAAEQALGFAGMTIGDVLDTLGSRECPDVAACLAVLVDPARFAGCTVTACMIAEAAEGDAPAASARTRWTNGMAA